MHFNAAVRSACVQMDCEHRVGCKALGYALTTANQSDLIYRRTGNLRAVQLLLGHLKIKSTVRYLGIEVDDAQTQILLKHKICLTM
jgi:hypothetical protein